MGLKYRIVEWYINQRNRFQKGISETSFIRGLVELYVLAAVYIKLILNREVPAWLLIAAIAAGFFLMWVFGYLWDRKGLFVIENEWGNKRNAFQIEMRKKFNIRDADTKKDK